MSSKKRRALATAMLGILGCATGGGGPSGVTPLVFESENRVVISDFLDVQAVAASPWLVFGATLHGLVIYDRVAHRFRPPITALDGYPAGRVRRAIADQTGNAVWLDLGTAGGYVRFDIDGRTWTTGQLPSDQNSGSLTVEAALARAPLADAMRAAILTDARLRTHQFTAAAATPDRPEIFLGTNGLGLVRVDAQTGEWEVLTYGLLAPNVGALALAPEGVWTAQRRGVTLVTRDLTVTRSNDLSFLYSRRLIFSGDQLWVVTEQGVVRIDQSTGRSRTWNLPDATALARTREGMWVGTTHGLSIIREDDQIDDVASNGIPMLCLLAAGDTLWAGTSVGLGQVLPGTAAITVPPELAQRATLHVPVYALAQLDDTLVMATERQLLWRNPATHEWSALVLPATLGRPTALTGRPGEGLWVGGTLGLAQADLSSGLIHVHPVPFEIPAAVRDLAVDRSYLWAATDSGLMRIQ
jgi:ligand-binding sensor domain-containing protein